MLSSLTHTANTNSLCPRGKHCLASKAVCNKYPAGDPLEQKLFTNHAEMRKTDAKLPATRNHPFCLSQCYLQFVTCHWVKVPASSFSYMHTTLFFLFLAVLGLHCCPGFPLFVDHGLSSKQARWLWHTGFVALRHMESSLTRDGTHVPYTCRQVLHPEHRGSPSCQLLQRPRQCPFPLHRMECRSRDSPGWTKSGTTQLGSDPNPTVHKLCDISKWLSLSGLAFSSQRQERHEQQLHSWGERHGC